MRSKPLVLPVFVLNCGVPSFCQFVIELKKKQDQSFMLLNSNHELITSYYSNNYSGTSLKGHP